MKNKHLLILLPIILSGCANNNNPLSVSSYLDNSSFLSTESDVSIDSSLENDSSTSLEEASSTFSSDSLESKEQSSSESTSSFEESSSFLESSSTPQSEIDKYYAPISSSLKGTALKSALYNIIKGHTKMSYDNLEQCMLYTDRNWDVSPDENDPNPVMDLLYYTKNDDSSMRQTWNKYHSSNNPVSPQMWDKEHIWAKSNGFPSKGSIPYSDLHHLRASDMKNNNSRSSYPFGEITSGGKNILDFSGTVSGRTGSCNGTTVYEPLDEDKGDVARALLYMATRYGEESFALTLTDGKDSSGGKWGFLSTLLKWNREDLPDEFEIRRNNIIYEKYQHNRNPFIDHPEYADRIYL